MFQRAREDPIEPRRRRPYTDQPIDPNFDFSDKKPE